VKKRTVVKVGICFLALSLCCSTSYVWAEGESSFAGEAMQSPGASHVPAAKLTDPPSANVLPPVPPTVADSMDFIASNPVGQTPIQPPSIALPVSDLPVHQNPGSGLSEQQVGILVDGVINGMMNPASVVSIGIDIIPGSGASAGSAVPLGSGVNSRSGSNLSEVLNTVDSGDPLALANAQQDHPEVLDQLITSIEKNSKKYSEDDPSKVYLDDWRKEAEKVRDELRSRQGGRMSDSLVSKLTKLYQPIAKRVSEITKGLEAVTASYRNRGEKGAELSSADILKGFSEEAKAFIVNSINQAQINLADGMLSDPLGTTAFAAEAAPVLISGDVFGARKMTVAEMYTKGQSQKFQVIDSIYIGKDFIRAQKMLHPPANLHPYLKWLLYTRNLTPRMMETYLATRKAILDIYGRAKAGQGDIRYRGKVYGAFLPFAETAVGNYELVKPAPAE